MAEKKSDTRWRLGEANEKNAELLRDDGIKAVATFWEKKDAWGAFIRAPRTAGAKDLDAWKKLLADRYGALEARRPKVTVSGFEVDLTGAGPRKKA